MANPFAESESPDQREPAQQNGYGFFSFGMIRSVLCLPLGVLGAAGAFWALCFPVFIYPRLLHRWPEMREVYPLWPLPQAFVVLLAAVIICAGAFIFAALVGLAFRNGVALWTVRKAYVLAYVLFVIHFAVTIGVTGAVAETLNAQPEPPPDGFVLPLFAWRCTWLAPAVFLLLIIVVLHVLSWRRAALNAYSGTHDEEPAGGDRVVENVRTHGRDPAFRKSVYGSVIAHLLVIVIIPFLLTLRTGCIRPYRVPLGSGKPAVAMMKVVKPKKKKKRKKYILSKDSPIIFDVPDLDDSKLVEEIEEATQLTYVADTNAAHGAMGTGGGNKPGWADGFADGEVRFIRLEYDGPDWDDGMEPSEAADINFLAEFKRLAGGINTARHGESHPISHLRQYPKGEAPPFVYMTGSGKIHLNRSDIEVLREYCRGGGMLFADAGSGTWDRNFRQLVQAVFPGKPLIPIADDDPIFQIPFTFPNGPPPLWFHGGKQTMGVKYKGRWAVFYFPGDLNDAWKTGNSGIDPVLAEAAYHLGTNVVYYSFTRYLEETRKYRK